MSGSWTNCSYGNWAHEMEMVELAKTDAELQYYKRRAKELVEELENIGRALREYGEWSVKDRNGEVTHVILNPEYHPSEGGE
ncbi:MAG: hypothetical protein V6Z86_05510 [Hyphomicrobiales bacterium]